MDVFTSLGKIDLAGRLEAVVDRLIPLITQGLTRHGVRLASLQLGHGGISPDLELGVSRWHGIRIRTAVHHPQLTSQRVLRLPAITRRAEPRISPLPRPGGRV